jgi:hypothetical protein
MYLATLIANVCLTTGHTIPVVTYERIAVEFPVWTELYLLTLVALAPF